LIVTRKDAPLSQGVLEKLRHLMTQFMYYKISELFSFFHPWLKSMGIWLEKIRVVGNYTENPED